MTAASSPQTEQQVPSIEQMQIDHWKVVYEAAQKAWDIRVEEVQNQQQRIASVVAANGLLLGFLGGTIQWFAQGIPTGLPIYLYLSAMCALAVGLGAGAMAMWPIITPKGRSNATGDDNSDASLFLEASQIFCVGQDEGAERLPQGTQHLYERLANSIASDAWESWHVGIIKARKRYIKVQLACFVMGAVILLIAVFARLAAF